MGIVSQVSERGIEIMDDCINQTTRVSTTLRCAADKKDCPTDRKPDGDCLDGLSGTCKYLRFENVTVKA